MHDSVRAFLLKMCVCVCVYKEASKLNNSNSVCLFVVFCDVTSSLQSFFRRVHVLKHYLIPYNLI